jgi:hypothetical protein
MPQIVQLDAPCNGLQRTLHVFACLRVSCGAGSGRWCALRSQRAATADAALETRTAVPDAAVATAGAWGAAAGGADGDAWGGGGDWDVGSDGESDDDGALDWGASVGAGAGATAPDQVAQYVAPIAPAATPPPVPPAPAAATTTTHGASVCPEYAFYFDGEPATASDRVAARAQLLAAKYGEENPELMALRSLVEVDGGASAAALSAATSAGDVYEDTPAAEAAMLAFQSRMQRRPAQLMRYEYGGEPLWCVPGPVPTAPPCACGSPRIFELQLMPELLVHLRAESAKKRRERAAKPAGKAAAEDAPDWCTVALFCCAASCDESRVEHVVVLEET